MLALTVVRMYYVRQAGPERVGVRGTLGWPNS